MNKNNSLKNAILITFGIDILGIAIAVSRAIILERSPMRYFGEGGFMTWISVIQLFVIAIFCWKIGNVRKLVTKTRINKYRFLSKKKTFLFWYIAGAGMFFFALDDAFKIHENLDRFILKTLEIENTSFTTRLDDFIILFYAIIGLLTIYWFRGEIKHYRNALPWFKLGIFFSFMTIFLDMFGHNRETFAPFADNLDELNYIHHWVSAFEEMPKILAGGAFLVSVFCCLQIAKKITKPQESYRQSQLESQFDN